MKGTGRPRVADVAALAGVSVGTVSNVLNRRTTVSPAIRDRVVAAIDELGFVPNASAKSLRQGYTPALGVLVQGLSNPSYASMVAGVQDRLEMSNMTTMLCSSEGDPEREIRFLRLFAEQRVRGVLVTPSQETAINILPLRDRAVPVLVMDTVYPPADDITYLGIDQVEGARMAVGHLLEMGRRKLAMLTGPSVYAHSTDRVQGARKALAEAGLDPDDLVVVELDDTSADAGRRGVVELFEARGLTPDGLFCVSDVLALGAMKELRRLGLQVPGDVAVVGYGDQVFSSELTTPLTSVREPMYDMGWKAADLMVTEVFGRVVFQPELVVRASSDPSVPR